MIKKNNSLELISWCQKNRHISCWLERSYCIVNSISAVTPIKYMLNNVTRAVKIEQMQTRLLVSLKTSEKRFICLVLVGVEFDLKNDVKSRNTFNSLLMVKRKPVKKESHSYTPLIPFSFFGSKFDWKLYVLLFIFKLEV